MYLIGQGECLPIAREAALKIKEITYIHAEAFSAGELKHGPIALLEEGRKTVVVILVFGDERQECLLALQECKAREAICVVVTDRKEVDMGKADEVLEVMGDAGILAPFVSVVIF